MGRVARDCYFARSGEARPSPAPYQVRLPPRVLERGAASSDILWVSANFSSREGISRVGSTGEITSFSGTQAPPVAYQQLDRTFILVDQTVSRSNWVFRCKV